MIVTSNVSLIKVNDYREQTLQKSLNFRSGSLVNL